MRVVTTCSKEGFESYGHRLLETWSLWPRDVELHWYVEGFELPEDRPGNIVQRPIEHLMGLFAFKSKHGKYQPPSYLFDVVRFAHKVYAAVDALSNYEGIGVWMDADCVTRQRITPGLIESYLPAGAYMAMYKRAGMYTETGFWICDCRHPQNMDFLESWVSWYESGNFKQLANWTDCETLDATVRAFEKQRLIKTASLSEGHEKLMHPMSQSSLGEYIYHAKGARKHLPDPEVHAEQDKVSM